MDGLAMFHGPNAGYVLDLYDRYLRDPESIDHQTRALFAAMPVDRSAAGGRRLSSVIYCRRACVSRRSSMP